MKKVLTIGGGTGTFTLLTGLKKYKGLDLISIISSADDGGSNKKFRDEFGLLPPSDFWKCLVALSSDEPQHDTIRKLMMYRFSKGVGLEGQTVGNILIAALTEIEGSQMKAFEEIGKILNIKGEILPVTTDNVRLMAEYENGDIAFGEHLIDEPEDFHDSTQKVKRLFLNRKAKLYTPAKEAIEKANYIIMGPGDLYTSTIANLIVGNTAKVISKTKAKIIFVVNLMTKYGQTFNFSASDHIKEVTKYLGRYPDYVIVNKDKIPEAAVKRYKKEKNDIPVLDDLEQTKETPYKIIKADIVNKTILEKAKGDNLNRSLIRHDSIKLADVIYKIINKQF